MTRAMEQGKDAPARVLEVTSSAGPHGDMRRKSSDSSR